MTGVSQAQTVVAGYLAPAGCAQAHCDQALSGNAQEPAPAGPVAPLWHDTSVAGSLAGLGCSSNTSLVACSFASTPSQPTSLRAYSPGGAVLWSSTLLNTHAATSAPMVSPAGGVIAADSVQLVSYNQDGSLAWSTNTPGGTPWSPVITDQGVIVLATTGGPISAYDAATGKLLSTLWLNGTVTAGGVVHTGYYETLNTPAVNGNRVYISTQFHDSATNSILPYGRLYAIDFGLTGAGTESFSVAWSYNFAAPSGGSPSVVVNQGVPTIYFDGSGIIPGAKRANPQLFAVSDLGSSARLDWRYAMPLDPRSAATPDPRGGVWTFAPYSPNLVRLNGSTGAVMQTIDVSSLLGGPYAHLPSSATVITGSATDPVMILSASGLLLRSSDIVAIDLDTSTLRWSYEIDQMKGRAGVSFGQFPVVQTATGMSEVVFTTYGNGVWGLGS